MLRHERQGGSVKIWVKSGSIKGNNSRQRRAFLKEDKVVWGKVIYKWKSCGGQRPDQMKSLYHVQIF